MQGHGADNVFLGKQECANNFWETIDYSLPNAYTAIVVGNNLAGPSGSTLANNKFFVQSLNSNYGPVDRNPMEGWFQVDNDCPEVETGCSASLQGPPVSFDENDEWVRSNYPSPQGSPEVEEWQSTRYLMAKLMRYPQLLTGDALTFKTAYDQSSASLFARFDSMMNAIAYAVSDLQDSLDILDINIRNKQAQINALDAGVVDYSALEPGYLSGCAALLGELAVFSQARSAILVRSAGIRDSLLTACQQFNNTLPASQVYEQNQKFINAVTIKNIQGIELTQGAKDTLHGIAQQCLQVAGRTKSAAASMLPTEEGGQYWREDPDADNCHERSQRLKNEQLASAFTVFPNPASDLLQIRFEAPAQGEIAVLDVSGRTVARRTVPEETTSLEISVNNFENGAYWLSFVGASGQAPRIVRFVIMR